jgi:hypothetical protein
MDKSVVWYEDKELIIWFNHKPNTNMIDPLPSMTKQEKALIARFPFINCTSLEVKLTDIKKNVTHCFTIPKHFRWDGASIPAALWIIIGAKTDARFRIPSLIHDYMCNNKYIVNFDRNFSSRVFKALLKVAGVSKTKCSTMYHAVDNWQKFQGWGKR